MKGTAVRMPLDKIVPFLLVFLPSPRRTNPEGSGGAAHTGLAGSDEEDRDGAISESFFPYANAGVMPYHQAVNR